MVPQGFIRGPILFSLYFITCKVSTVMTHIIFADGTNLTICINGNNIETFDTTDYTVRLFQPDNIICSIKGFDIISINANCEIGAISKYYHSKKIKSKYSCIILSVLIMPKMCFITAMKCGEIHMRTRYHRYICYRKNQ